MRRVTRTANYGPGVAKGTTDVLMTRFNFSNNTSGW